MKQFAFSFFFGLFILINLHGFCTEAPGHVSISGKISDKRSGEALLEPPFLFEKSKPALFPMFTATTR